jgi:hypothetical protein
MTLTTVPPEVDRDRYGRPLIKPKGQSKAVPYTRCTTFVSAFEDTYNLEKWKMRQTAVGLSLREDLRLSVAAHKDDKRKLDAACEQAMEAAASSSGATKGTALHAMTEQVDRGLELVGVPAEFLPDIAAYKDATAELQPVYIEQLTVHDPWQVAGTPDRVVRYRGKRYIADLKTGDIEYGCGKIAAQLAMYARSEVYDIATGERTMHGAELDKGLVIHLPAGTGTCTVWWIDLLAGWEIARTCRDVRERRKLKFKDLTTTFAEAEVDLTTTVAESLEANLEQQILAATSADAIRALWPPNEAVWTDHLTQVAKDRIASLGTAAPRQATEGATA